MRFVVALLQKPLPHQLENLLDLLMFGRRYMVWSVFRAWR
jgi:hypothetical protein